MYIQYLCTSQLPLSNCLSSISDHQNYYSTLFRTDDMVKLAYHFLFPSFHVISGTFFFISSLVCIQQYDTQPSPRQSASPGTQAQQGPGNLYLPTACTPKIMPSNLIVVDPNPMGMVCVHSSASLGLKSTSYPALSFFVSLHPRVYLLRSYALTRHPWS